MFLARKLSLLLLWLAIAATAVADTPPEKLLAQGRVDDAIAALRQKTSAAPKDAEAYNLLCRAYYSLGQWDRGIAECEKATQLAPDNGRYHLWLGRIYGEKADASGFWTAAGLVKKVRTEFEAAARLSPDSADAHSDLAEFYLEAPSIVGGGRDKAEAQAQILDKLDPAKADYIRGRIEEKKKDRAAAERQYRAAIATTHGSALTWFNLALFYRHASEYDQMAEAVKHAVAAPMTSPEVLVESAEILIRAGRDYPLAIELLQRYLDSEDKVEQAPAFKAHYLLGTALEKQGNKQGAMKQYNDALALARNYSPAEEALKQANR